MAVSLCLQSPRPSTMRGIPAGLTQAWIEVWSLAQTAPPVSAEPRMTIAVLTAYNLLRARMCSPNPFISIPQTTISYPHPIYRRFTGGFLSA